MEVKCCKKYTEAVCMKNKEQKTVEGCRAAIGVPGKTSYYCFF